jgi:hypothetical protein
MKIEVLPGIWVNNKFDSKLIEEKNITNIINVDNDLSFMGNSVKYNDTIRENVEKYEILKMVNYLKEITLFMKNCILKSENILIYCESGLQKTPTLILAFLIRYGYLTKEIAIEMIRTKLIDAFKPTLEYNNSIEIFIKQLKN